jgi:RTX calcium-binding nonapeptide repeat (4 copies)
MKIVGRIAAVAVAGLLIALLALPAGAAKRGPFGERCEYVEAGPAGPKGNRLVVAGAGAGSWLNRHGNRIVVHEGFEPCMGRQATVHNIDRIVLKGESETYVLGQRSGAFSPGATRERSGSEIEITVAGEGLEVVGRERADAIQARTLYGEAVAVNLNRREDGRYPDFDVVIRGGEAEAELPEVVRIEGGGGDDLIDVRRLTGMGDNTLLRSRIRLQGGSGDDTIFGSPGDEYRLQDGPGDDLVRAGGGDDDVEFGPGRDTIYGGEGGDGLTYAFPLEVAGGHPDAADRLFGGPGADVIQDDNGHPDVIRCGPGNDLLDGKGRDRSSDCEKVRHGRGDLI